MRLRAILAVIVTVLATLPAARAPAHDMPASIPVRAFFDYGEDGAELLLRVPLTLLLNVNLPKRGPGYLDLGNLGEGRGRAERAVIDAFPLRADGVALEPDTVASRIRQPSSDAFASYENAVAEFEGPPLPPSENVFWNQGYFDIRLGYDAPGPTPGYAVAPDLPGGIASGMTVHLTVLAPGEGPRSFIVPGSTPVIPIDPSALQVAGQFVAKGVEHIVTGIDHLLFLVCLVLPLYDQPKRLLIMATAFTAGHTATLIPAALGAVPAAAWFSPLVEGLIALSILYLAAENIFGADARRRWWLTLAFGLVHGLGFAGSLGNSLELVGGQLIPALLAFNVGIELGQIVVLAVVIAAAALAFRTEAARRIGVIVISVLIGHEGWNWMLERFGQIDVAAMAALEGPRLFAMLAWAGAGLAVLAAVWFWLAQRRRPQEPAE